MAAKTKGKSRRRRIQFMSPRLRLYYALSLYEWRDKEAAFDQMRKVIEQTVDDDEE